MNLLKVFIESLPLEVQMNFGINGPVIINNIDITDRLTRKGDPHSKNFFMEFHKLDKEGTPFQREEFSFFKLRADKLKFLSDNFFDQFNKMYSFAKLFMSEEDLNEVIKSTMAAVYEDNENANYTDLIDHLDFILLNESRTIKPKEKLSPVELVVEVDKLNKNLNSFWFTILTPYFKNTETPFQLIVTVDKKGYKNLVDEVDFAFPVEESIALDMKYLHRKEQAEKPEKADTMDNEDSSGLNDLVDDASEEFEEDFSEVSME